VKSISYQKFVIDSLLLSLVEWSYLNTDMRKFESSQKHESRAQLADSSKAYKKRRAFYWLPCNKIWKYFSNICVYLFQIFFKHMRFIIFRVFLSLLALMAILEIAKHHSNKTLFSRIFCVRSKP